MSITTSAPTSRVEFINAADFYTSEEALTNLEDGSFHQGSVIRLHLNDGTFAFYYVNSPLPTSPENRQLLISHYLNKTEGYTFTEANKLVKEHLKTFALYTTELNTQDNQIHHALLAAFHCIELKQKKQAQRLSEQQASLINNQANYLAALTIFMMFFKQTRCFERQAIKILDGEINSLETIAKGIIPKSLLGAVRLKKLLQRSCKPDAISQNIDAYLQRFMNIYFRLLTIFLQIHQAYSEVHAKEVADCLKNASEFRIEIGCGRGMATAALNPYLKVSAASDLARPIDPWPNVEVFQNSIVDTIKFYSEHDVLYLLHHPIGRCISEVVETKLPVLIYATGKRTLFEDKENVQLQILSFEHQPTCLDDDIACLLGINMTSEKFREKVELIPEKYLKK
ncbi:hypothetical protein D5018_05720 [Parashewanella curva]|uniref:Uncharacterized protein n=1 Tax=Parashewanella curva TaxID=2338552 RepID=A0A3L8PZ08_9GAMM|nr:hypothetical protein [Parashewanella curva]RLV60601.1 hypothetical protein D5018_05720 [Parashewanella curva]